MRLKLLITCPLPAGELEDTDLDGFPDINDAFPEDPDMW